MIQSFAVSLWAAVAVAIYSVEFARPHLKLRIRGRQPFNRKPFNCEACLPVWLFAAFLPIAIHQYNIVAILASACTAGIITPLIIKRIRS